MYGIDEGTAAVTVVLITAIVAPTWMAWWNGRKTRRDTAQISRAVNHVPDGDHTLVQRVTWIESAITSLARHVGCHLPDKEPPNE